MDFTRAARRMDLLLIRIVKVVCKAVFQSKKGEGVSFGHVHFRHPLDVRLEVRYISLILEMMCGQKIKF